MRRGNALNTLPPISVLKGCVASGRHSLLLPSPLLLLYILPSISTACIHSALNLHYLYTSCPPPPLLVYILPFLSHSLYTFRPPLPLLVYIARRPGLATLKPSLAFFVRRDFPDWRSGSRNHPLLISSSAGSLGP